MAIEIVVGVFDDQQAAGQARAALLRAGVTAERIALAAEEPARPQARILSVETDSTFVREKVRDVLRRNGARRTELRYAQGGIGEIGRPTSNARI
jgi:hypothetical protein